MADNAFSNMGEVIRAMRDFGKALNKIKDTDWNKLEREESIAKPLPEVKGTTFSKPSEASTQEGEQVGEMLCGSCHKSLDRDGKCFNWDCSTGKKNAGE